MNEQKPATVSPAKIGEAKKSTAITLAADFGIVYCKVQGGQLMAPIKADMTLFEKLGHVYKQKDKYLVTATGYKYLNKVASISIVTPQSVIVDERPVPNPHIERNSRTKAIESVNIRKMGIGYSPAGNIVVIDKTLFYNVYTYFIQAIQAKMSRAEWATVEGGRRQKTDKKEFPNCAVYGIADEKPTIPGRWAFYPTEEPLGIWINYEDQAIVDCLEEHTQRQRFGDRMATTIVERNILKDHPAIAVSQVFEKSGPAGIQATVTVHGWRNDNSPRNISEIMRRAEGGKDSADFEIQAEVITEIDAEEEKAARKEVVEAEGEAIEPEVMGNPAKDKEPPQAFFDKQAKELAKEKRGK
jgi:hypothetical protein